MGTSPLIRRKTHGSSGRRFVSGVAFFLAGILLATTSAAHRAETRPNILWILLDACRTNMACYGYERITSPNIDALAARGVVFERTYTQGNETVVSVPSYMTGRYFAAACIGLYGEYEEYRNVRLPVKGEFLLPDVLGKNGYETAMIAQGGAWFSVQDRLPRAFDEFVGVDPGQPPLVTFEELLPHVMDYISRKRSRPFFLYLHTWDTHFPHAPEPPYDRFIELGYPRDSIEQSNASYSARRVDNDPFNERDKQFLRAIHDGSILYADAHVGKIVAQLAALGILDDTLIIISADHGDVLGEDGQTVGHGRTATYEGVARVPLIMAGPGVPQGRRVPYLTQNIDIFPTVLALANAKSKAETDGVSLLPWMRGEKAEAPHAYAFIKAKTGPIFSVRDSQFNYEHELATRREALYPAPDRLGARRDVLAEHPQRAEQMRAYLEQTIVSRWQARDASPVMAVFLKAQRYLTVRVGSGGPVVWTETAPTEKGRDDGAWSLYRGQFFAAPFAEMVAPLRFSAEVRDGRYGVWAEVLEATDYGGHPASSIAIRITGMPSFRTMTCQAKDIEEPILVHLKVGECCIEGGVFEAVVKRGKPTHWASLKNLVLVPCEPRAEAEFERLIRSEAATQKETLQRLDELEALGYLE